MQQTLLPLRDNQLEHPVVPLEEEQEQALIELMAQAIAAVMQPGQGEHDETV